MATDCVEPGKPQGLTYSQNILTLHTPINGAYVITLSNAALRFLADFKLGAVSSLHKTDYYSLCLLSLLLSATDTLNNIGTKQSYTMRFRSKKNRVAAVPDVTPFLSLLARARAFFPPRAPKKRDDGGGGGGGGGDGGESVSSEGVGGAGGSDSEGDDDDGGGGTPFDNAAILQQLLRAHKASKLVTEPLVNVVVELLPRRTEPMDRSEGSEGSEVVPETPQANRRGGHTHELSKDTDTDTDTGPGSPPRHHEGVDGDADPDPNPDPDPDSAEVGLDDGLAPPEAAPEDGPSGAECHWPPAWSSVFACTGSYDGISINSLAGMRVIFSLLDLENAKEAFTQIIQHDITVARALSDRTAYEPAGSSTEAGAAKGRPQDLEYMCVRLKSLEELKQAVAAVSFQSQGTGRTVPGAFGNEAFTHGGASDAWQHLAPSAMVDTVGTLCGGAGAVVAFGEPRATRSMFATTDLLAPLLYSNVVHHQARSLQNTHVFLQQLDPSRYTGNTTVPGHNIIEFPGVTGFSVPPEYLAPHTFGRFRWGVAALPTVTPQEVAMFLVATAGNTGDTVLPKVLQQLQKIHVGMACALLALVAPVVAKWGTRVEHAAAKYAIQQVVDLHAEAAAEGLVRASDLDFDNDNNDGPPGDPGAASPLLFEGGGGGSSSSGGGGGARPAGLGSGSASALPRFSVPDMDDVIRDAVHMATMLNPPPDKAVAELVPVKPPLLLAVIAEVRGFVLPDLEEFLHDCQCDGRLVVDDPELGPPELPSDPNFYRSLQVFNRGTGDAFGDTDAGKDDEDEDGDEDEAPARKRHRGCVDQPSTEPQSASLRLRQARNILEEVKRTRRDAAAAKAALGAGAGAGVGVDVDEDGVSNWAGASPGADAGAGPGPGPGPGAGNLPWPRLRPCDRVKADMFATMRVLSSMATPGTGTLCMANLQQLFEVVATALFALGIHPNALKGLEALQRHLAVLSLEDLLGRIKEAGLGLASVSKPRVYPLDALCTLGADSGPAIAKAYTRAMELHRGGAHAEAAAEVQAMVLHQARLTVATIEGGDVHPVSKTTSALLDEVYATAHAARVVKGTRGAPLGSMPEFGDMGITPVNCTTSLDSTFLVQQFAELEKGGLVYDHFIVAGASLVLLHPLLPTVGGAPAWIGLLGPKGTGKSVMMKMAQATLPPCMVTEVNHQTALAPTGLGPTQTVQFEDDVDATNMGMEKGQPTRKAALFKTMATMGRLTTQSTFVTDTGERTVNTKVVIVRMAKMFAGNLSRGQLMDDALIDRCTLPTAGMGGVRRDGRTPNASVGENRDGPGWQATCLFHQVVTAHVNLLLAGIRAGLPGPCKLAMVPMLDRLLEAVKAAGVDMSDRAREKIEAACTLAALRRAVLLLLQDAATAAPQLDKIDFMHRGLALSVITEDMTRAWFAWFAYHEVDRSMHELMEAIALSQNGHLNPAVMMGQDCATGAPYRDYIMLEVPRSSPHKSVWAWLAQHHKSRSKMPEAEVYKTYQTLLNTGVDHKATWDTNEWHPSMVPRVPPGKEALMPFLAGVTATRGDTNLTATMAAVLSIHARVGLKDPAALATIYGNLLRCEGGSGGGGGEADTGGAGAGGGGGGGSSGGGGSGGGGVFSGILRGGGEAGATAGLSRFTAGSGSAPDPEPPSAGAGAGAGAGGRGSLPTAWAQPPVRNMFVEVRPSATGPGAQSDARQLLIHFSAFNTRRAQNPLQTVTSAINASRSRYETGARDEARPCATGPGTGPGTGPRPGVRATTRPLVLPLGSIGSPHIPQLVYIANNDAAPEVVLRMSNVSTNQLGRSLTAATKQAWGPLPVDDPGSDFTKSSSQALNMLFAVYSPRDGPSNLDMRITIPMDTLAQKVQLALFGFGDSDRPGPLMTLFGRKRSASDLVVVEHLLARERGLPIVDVAAKRMESLRVAQDKARTCNPFASSGMARAPPAARKKA